jgi:CheY-like chemotaxis protein
MEAGAEIPFGPGPLKGMRVLIVEDNAMTAYLLEGMLLESGARLVGSCASAAEAIRCMRSEQQLDFALIDLKLADQFADTLIEEAICRRLRFAILTGMVAFPSNVHEHAIAVLRKPVSQERLINLLTNFV